MSIDLTLPQPTDTASTANIAAYQRGYLAAKKLGKLAVNPWNYAKLYRFSTAKQLYKYWGLGHELGLSEGKVKEKREEE